LNIIIERRFHVSYSIWAQVLCLPNAPRNHFPNYQHLFCQRSKSRFRFIMTLDYQGWFGSDVNSESL